jgi:hypothetical protein
LFLASFMTVGPAAAEREPRQKDRLFESMLAGYVGLQLTDVYLTQRGTSMGLTEENPIFTSGDSVSVAKLALAPLTAWGLVKLHRTHPKLARGLTFGLNTLYLGVAYSNSRVISEVE